MAPITLQVQSRSGRTIAEVSIDDQETVLALKKRFAQLKRKPVSRQRLTLPPADAKERGAVLDDDTRLAKYSLADGSVVVFKDLGPQIGYTTVFFWEYFGPLAIYPLFYFLPGVFYPSHRPTEHVPAQTLACAFWTFHYAKRILETFLVHRFGHATMPLANLFRNCAYYWLFAAFVSWHVNHPLFTPPPPAQTYGCLAAALVAQLCNLRCHLILARLRKPGDKGYSIPRGFLFEFVTCANYTAEVAAWVLFSVAVQTLAALLFAAAGAYQMTVWALQKHRRLRKLFNGKDGAELYPRRWVIFPPIL